MDSENRQATRITIVGGRPPDEGRDLDEVPHGMQNLLLMAAEDERLREALLSDRVPTLERCGVLLSDTERKVLASVPAAQLEQMIGRVGEQVGGRRDFLRTAAASVVALLAGTVLPGCAPQGIRPDDPRDTQNASPPYDAQTKGIRPDRPPSPAPTSPPSGSPSGGPSPRPGGSGTPTPPPAGSRPDLPGMQRGISPDRPNQR